MENDFYSTLANLDFIVNRKAGYYEASCMQYPSIKHVTEDAALSLDLVKNEVYRKIKKTKG